MHIKPQIFNRIVLFEKCPNGKENRFPFTSKGLKESYFFINSLGGWDEVYKTFNIAKPWFGTSTEFYLSMANKIWKNLK